jgi:hypothetical protein
VRTTRAADAMKMRVTQLISKIGKLTARQKSPCRDHGVIETASGGLCVWRRKHGRLVCEHRRFAHGELEQHHRCHDQLSDRRAGLHETARAGSGEPSGNYGVQDMIATLQWVKDYIAAMNALLDWEASGSKPSALDVTQWCVALDAKWNPSDCMIDPIFDPAPLSTRMPAR